MNDMITSIDRVRAEAIAAARKNESPMTACKYPFGSTGARLWMVEYSKEVNRLQNADRRRARQQDQEGNQP